MTELQAKKHLSVLLLIIHIKFMLLAHILIRGLSTELKLRKGKRWNSVYFCRSQKFVLLIYVQIFFFVILVAQGMVMTISFVFLPANLFCPDFRWIAVKFCPKIPVCRDWICVTKWSLMFHLVTKAGWSFSGIYRRFSLHNYCSKTKSQQRSQRTFIEKEKNTEVDLTSVLFIACVASFIENKLHFKYDCRDA